MDEPHRAEFLAVLRHGVRIPFRDARFWVIQAMVIVIAVLHLEVDLHSSLEKGDFPAGIPVALLIVPVTYAALRYGLAGSAATGAWATLLWLPDLTLAHDQGHTGGDLVNLALVDFVAFVIGLRIEAERLAHARAERTIAERLAVEARYHHLFEANSAPTVILDAHGVVMDANPAARVLFGSSSVGRDLEALLSSEFLGSEVALDELPGRTVHLPNGNDYRVNLARLPVGPDAASILAVFEDVTEEREEGRRATRYAALVIRVEEDQRRRLSRELHDEPLQLFLHLARRLESLGESPGVPAVVTSALGEARTQALDAAARLRTLARDLRPPTLDRLGLVAALSSLLADVEEQTGLTTDLCVNGDQVRLPSDAELGVFRIAQESVRNTLRHARAREVRVILFFTPDSLMLVVADDGLGFDAQGISGHGGAAHLGMLGMRERAHLLGGSLKVRSAPGEGTQVEATIPLRDVRNASATSERLSLES